MFYYQLFLNIDTSGHGQKPFNHGRFLAMAALSGPLAKIKTATRFKKNMVAKKENNDE